ncbi:uncharacterized protein LOC111060422 [Nilaparvata lugens]|uniref:uncharacterized protein LOC111060422 n=1 Tax=Nilaparvata lugens TaxID=108931 RepID=UPI00193D7C08|nr:uncharacterized protein LOC111060422 [Nilaparvata lugens]
MPPWKYESQMSFLLLYMQGKAISGDFYDVDAYKDDVEVDLMTATPAVELGNGSSSPSYVVMRSPTPEDSIASNHLNGGVDTVYRRMHHTKHSTNGVYHPPELDENDHFFLSMSKSLKRLPAISQARIKMDLHRAIYQAEMSLLENLEQQDSMSCSPSVNIKRE